jgi:hypothetical protein
MATFSPGDLGGITPVRRVDVPASNAADTPGGADMMMAMNQQNRMNLLRPDPKYAMLAYMMVSASPLDSRRDRDDDRDVGFV